MTTKPVKMGTPIRMASGSDIEKSGHFPERVSPDRTVESNKEEKSMTAIAQNLIKTSEEFFLGKGIPGEGK